MTEARSFKQLYFFLFAPFALQMTFLNLYYERRGLSHGEIGSLGAVTSALSIVAPLLFGVIADRLGRKQWVLFGLALGVAIFMPSQWFASSLIALGVLAVLVAICNSPLIPLTDALCLDRLHAAGDPQGNRYARIRVWGSVGFVVAACGVPQVIKLVDQPDPLRRLIPVFVCMGAAGLLFALRTATLPPSAHDMEAALGYDRPSGSLRTVLATPGLRRLVALLFGSWVANATYYVFLSLYLEKIGVADHLKGAYWSVGVAAEVVFMIFAGGLLQRLGVRRMLLLGLLGRTLRLVAFTYPLPPLVVLIFVQPLHALAFAAVHLGTIAFLARTVPAEHRATGQSLVAAVVSGLGGVIGNLMAGWISEAASLGALRSFTSLTGLYAAFLVATLVSTVVLLIAWLTLREPQVLAEE